MPAIIERCPRRILPPRRSTSCRAPGRGSGSPLGELRRALVGGALGGGAEVAAPRTLRSGAAPGHHRPVLTGRTLLGRVRPARGCLLLVVPATALLGGRVVLDLRGGDVAGE